MRTLSVIAASLALAACVPSPDSYGIPSQHGIVESAPKPQAEFGEFLKADDTGADRYFVKDVKPLEGAPWRWTLAEPELRFVLRSVHARTLRIEFGINDRTFRDTGPVTIVFAVNGHELDRVRYTSFGDKVFEKAVPEDWLKPAAENRVLMKILNPWQAPDPGVRLGVLLHSAGFPDK